MQRQTHCRHNDFSGNCCQLLAMSHVAPAGCWGVAVSLNFFRGCSVNFQKIFKDELDF